MAIVRRETLWVSVLVVTVCAGLILGGCPRPPAKVPPNDGSAAATITVLRDGGAHAVVWLSTVMDQFHDRLDVYSDADSAGNHFPARGRMSSPGGEDALPAMDEAWTTDLHSGATCIRAQFQARTNNWGGWYFMNGVLDGKDVTPAPNWGDVPDAGFDLRGATTLTFWVRGAAGGEQVEFFAFGVGRDPNTGLPREPYPDSAHKITLGYVTLAPTWTEYSLDVGNQDLGYVLGGFGWVTTAAINAGNDITFYLDDIRYNLPRLDQPRFLVSYETPGVTDFDRVMRNVAFVYDNAVAAIAFLAAGQPQRAQPIVDALVYAQQHDRFFNDGRLRNAYQAGDLWLPPGWTPHGRVNTVRMPGWYDVNELRWLEDRVQVSTYAGNMAWAMLALLAYYDTAGGRSYVAAAEQMGEWIEQNCRDLRGAGGYTGGFEGWEPEPTPLTYKATEHNIDLYVAFTRLYRVTGDPRWRSRAEYARRFVVAMWEPVAGHFWTGTLNDGLTVNAAVIPVDVQAWTVLALRTQGVPYRRSLDFAKQHLAVDGGFDFNDDRDGVWYEGTAQMAAAYREAGRTADAEALVTFLTAAQADSGAMPASSIDGLTTGFDWLYFHQAHVGATAWHALAARGVNPFWLGAD